ncbi:hypothetical protein M3Y95_00432200 [Aphelenchoides besseyi]|nr:hypothetical protein M3Y95_00432200 [Aphelenchoides besseyi]
MQSTMFRRRIAFQIMLSQTIVNASQLLLQSAASFHSVLDISINEQLNSMMGVLIDIFWATSLYLQFLLSVNRFSIMTLKSSESKYERKLMQILLTTTWIAGIASGLANKMVNSGLTFEITSLSWTMPTEERHPVYVAIYDTQLFFLTCTYIICILIVCSLIYRRRRYEQERSFIRPIEARIFAQTSIETLTTLSSIYLWDAANECSEEYVIALVNFQWVFICALPPYLTIALIELVTSLQQK